MFVSTLVNSISLNDRLGKSFFLYHLTSLVGTALLALSLRQAGYSVWANADASGAFDDKSAADANRRMESAGITVSSAFVIYAELLRDWRNTPGVRETFAHFHT